VVLHDETDRDYIGDILAGRLDPELVLWGYARGIFPMADPKTGKIDWYSPDPRGIIPLNRFYLPHSLRSILGGGKFRVTMDLAFERVIRACARREETWIDDRIIECYCRLHEMGFAHSVESWQDEELAGGLYGVSIGGAFFGESMFHKKTHGSKAALAGLVRQLRDQGYLLLDTQFITAHLARFGAETISREEYQSRLRRALRKKCEFVRPGQQTIGIK
jgi:leucyl/phenylalanyl-tRNA---protein transferase